MQVRHPHPDRSTKEHSAIRQQRLYAAVRSALIGYGVVAFTYLFSRDGLSNAAVPAPENSSASTLFLWGIGLQVALIALRVLIRRYAPSELSAEQVSLVPQLMGDGVTVLLFAIATLGAVRQAADVL